MVIEYVECVFGSAEVFFLSKFNPGSIKYKGISAGHILLGWDVVFARLHVFEIKKRIAIAVAHDGIRAVELIRNCSLDLLKTFFIRVQISDTVKKDIVVYLVPEVVAVATADMRAFVGEIHDDIPAIVAVEIVAQHSNVVVAILLAFIDAHQACTKHRTKCSEGFVVFAMVHRFAHSHISQGSINAEGGFRVIPPGFIPPDQGKKIAFLGEIKYIIVKGFSGLFPVSERIRFGVIGHFLNPGNIALLYRNCGRTEF